MAHAGAEGKLSGFLKRTLNVFSESFSGSAGLSVRLRSGAGECEFGWVTVQV